MKPDKIYASFINNGKMMVGCAVYPIINSSEYLRKDALLEWAKEELGNTSILRSETIEVLQKVIDKLNSF